MELPDNSDTEEDDKETAYGVTDFGHLLSLPDSFCDEAKDDGAQESDDQVDHRRI
jgi:hypothetical protein